ncbi:MAG: hypothetical protein GF398_03465 [Chitinivibrionales bacterium]|nr:hypothetical protein [Chitinivibrionales bacterium]
MPESLQDTRHKKETNTNIAAGIKAVMLCAGLGKRMLPLTTHHLPKPMFPLGGGVPMAEIWVKKLVAAGIADITMNLSVLSESIQGYFGNGQSLGADISYVREEEPSGTFGGACKMALGREAKDLTSNDTIYNIEPFTGDTVIIASGDIVTNFASHHLEQLHEIHKREGAAFTLVLSPVPWEERGEFGTVQLSDTRSRSDELSQVGRVRKFIEKDPASPSNLNNASIYLMDAGLLRMLDTFRTPARLDIEEPFYDFGKHVFPALLQRLDYINLPGDFPVIGVEYDGLWYDVGRKKDYLDVNRDVLDKKVNVDIPYNRHDWGYLGSPVSIDFDSVTIVPPVVIGNGCTIEAGATIGPHAVIGDGWHIASNAKVSNSVLWGRGDFYLDSGKIIPAEERKSVDPHAIRHSASVENCIVAGGSVEGIHLEETIDVLEDGSVDVSDIYQTYTGKRA